jgi:hypothetical protein
MQNRGSTGMYFAPGTLPKWAAVDERPTVRLVRSQ